MRTRAEIIAAFRPADRLNGVQNMKMMKTAKAFEDLALEVESMVPESADRTSALRYLLIAKFQCVQAITHVKQPIAPPPPPPTEGKDNENENKTSN